jgi:myo-inositol-1(or 4)-monophosphatase
LFFKHLLTKPLSAGYDPREDDPFSPQKEETMDSCKTVAVRAARKAGIILKSRLGRKRKVAYKGAVNLVTEMDILAEKIIVGEIQKRFPDHAVLAEERTAMEKPSQFRWIIDPLDGTTNYAHGFPIFSVSIALVKDEEVVLGVVYDPARDELFSAEKGKGAWLNGHKIRVSSENSLSRSLLATGFPYDLRESKINNFDHFHNFAVRSQAVRRAGSAALDLCYVAAGRFDGFWEMKLAPWDIAAGSLMVGEAGGKVTNFLGKPLNLGGKHILASNGKIHNAMLGVVKLGKFLK